MSLRERKQNFIEEYKAITDESVINDLENALRKAIRKKKAKKRVQGKGSSMNIVGSISKKDAEEWKRIIEDGRSGVNTPKGKKTKSLPKDKSILDFAGIWTKEEGAEMKRLIEESCETINPDDWK